MIRKLLYQTPFSFHLSVLSQLLNPLIIFRQKRSQYRTCSIKQKKVIFPTSQYPKLHKTTEVQKQEKEEVFIINKKKHSQTTTSFNLKQYNKYFGKNMLTLNFVENVCASIHIAHVEQEKGKLGLEAIVNVRYTLIFNL